MTRLSREAVAALTAVAAGRPVGRTRGVWRLGKAVVPETIVAELVRHDLARIDGHSLDATTPGVALLKRLAEGSDVLPNRLPGQRRLAPSDVIDRKTVDVNEAEAPLGWLARRGLVSPEQLAAGERLRGDYTLARIEPSITMRWDAAPGRGRGAPAAFGPGEAQMAARSRFEGALAAAGPTLKDLLWRVVCAGEGLETAEKAFGWPQRAGKVVLRVALDRLVEHYGG